ncbi:MAG: Uma2 family endonuclease [Candidatus Poribacteria bacterium]|nr:Uma2 family endonuclease [Candidatus Poribacteria bacterium]
MNEAVKEVDSKMAFSEAYPAAFPLHQIRRLSVKEYHWMGEVGILRPDERVELIDGVIRKMSPKGSRHTACVRKLTNLLPLLLQGRALVSVQDPIVLDDNTEPEPDVALVRPRDDAYARAHPRPGDVLLVIEVADTSLEDDRTVKLPRYAESGIPEVWLIDVADDVLAVYRQPISQPDDRAEYRLHTDYSIGDVISPLAFPDIELSVAAIL